MTRPTQSSSGVFDLGTSTIDRSSEQVLNHYKISIPFVALTSLIASALPIVAAIVLLLSETRGRRLLSSRRFSWILPPTFGEGLQPDLVKRATYTWSIALIVVGVLQAAGAVFMGLSVFDPLGFTVRLLGAMLLEVAVLLLLRRRGPRLRGFELTK